MAWASLSYGGLILGVAVSGKFPCHMCPQRVRASMMRSDWTHPPGIASIRCNSGAKWLPGNQSIDNSRSAQQSPRNEAKALAFDAFITVRSEHSEPENAVQKKSDLL